MKTKAKLEKHRDRFRPLDDRGPLRVLFVITSMPVGGAETLLVELIRRLDRNRFLPELCCLKEPGPLGDLLADEDPDLPIHSRLINNKYDVAVLGRLTRLMRSRRIDAVVTVGTGGDKMFWGRIAAIRAGVPVIVSALHSTGLPDHVELPNRILAPWTDAFVAVADPHALHLAIHEGCPARKVRVVPNGVDPERFHPRWPDKRLRQSCDLDESDSPTIGIIAALRPEKRHDRFLEVSQKILAEKPQATFLVIGDGTERDRLRALAEEMKISDHVRFLGSRSDVPELLSLFDLFLLTSEMEANPVSIWEALSCECPVIAFDVGSVNQAVVDGKTGYLIEPTNTSAMATRAIKLLNDPDLAGRIGRAGRERVLQYGSINRMITGYSDLITEIYRKKTARSVAASGPKPTEKEPVK
jgi:glycosyltransferase involved in cell wall biosynthesis